MAGTGLRRKKSLKDQLSIRASPWRLPRAVTNHKMPIVWSDGRHGKAAFRGRARRGNCSYTLALLRTLCPFVADLPHHSPNVTRCRVNFITLKGFKNIDRYFIRIHWPARTYPQNLCRCRKPVVNRQEGDSRRWHQVGGQDVIARARARPR